MARPDQYRPAFLIHESATFVEKRWQTQGFTFPADVAKFLGCTWVEAVLALKLAERIGYKIACRKDGRWYPKEKYVTTPSARA